MSESAAARSLPREAISDLFSLLESIRSQRNLSDPDVLVKLQRERKNYPSARDQRPRNRAMQRLYWHKNATLESIRKAFEILAADPANPIYPADLRPLEAVHELRPHMLAPFFARTKSVVACDRFDEFKVVSKNDPPNCDYKISAERLDAAGTYLVITELNGNAESIAHSHPGEECLAVLRGRVEVRLANGTRHQLNQYDIAHFDAEIKHFVVAEKADKDDPAVVLTVRINQHKDRAMRSEIRNHIGVIVDNIRNNKGGERGEKQKVKDLLPGHSEPAVGGVLSKVIADLNPWRETQSISNISESSVVQDIYGLGWFLRQMHGAGLLDCDSTMPNENTRNGYLYGNRTVIQLKSMMSRFGGGGLGPILYLPYFIPSHSSLVILRCGAARATSFFELKPSHYAETVETTYWVPAIRLANSDVAINIVKMRGGGHIPYNMHVGSELIAMIDGSVELFVEGEPGPVHIRAGGYAHFKSSAKHSLRASEGGAEFIVIRVYGKHG